MLRRGCAVLHHWRRARRERRLLGTLNSPWQESLPLPPAIPGVEGAKKYLQAPSQHQEEEEERKRGREEVGCAGMSGGEKTPVVPEHPRSLPEGRQGREPLSGQRHRPPAKKIPNFLHIATTRELKKYTVGGIITQKSPSQSLFLLCKTFPFPEKNKTLSVCPQFLTPAESCSLYKRVEEKERK